MGSSAELHQICTIDEENDLGITLSRDFKFKTHIHKIVQKANRVLGDIKCTFKYLDPNIMYLLYTSLVHPHLDYAIIYGTLTWWTMRILLRRYKEGPLNLFHCLSNILIIKDYPFLIS